jgi:hypothetical protein
LQDANDTPYDLGEGHRIIRGDTSITARDQVLSRVSKGAMSDNAAVLSEDHYVSDAARHAITEGYANQCPAGQ